MKKILIGAIVGGVIIFLWQFLSFALINFHRPAQDYTDKQETILSLLNSQQLKPGGYILPNVPEGTSMEDCEKLTTQFMGKPWARIEYHSTLQNNMTMNMIRGLFANFVMVFLFCWLVRRMNAPGFSTILLSALAVGLVVFLNVPYTNHIWYQTFDIWAHLGDALVSWGLTGLWLAWWLRRETVKQTVVQVQERPVEMSY